MTKAEIYEKLRKIGEITDALRIVDIKIERLEACAQGHAIRYDQDKVQTSPSDPVAQIIDDLSKLLDERKSLQTLMVRTVAEVSALLDLVSDAKQRLVLYYRYVGLLNWKGVAQQMRITERHAYRVHDSGIDEIFKKSQ